MAESNTNFISAINENFDEKIDWDNMQWSNDIFDILDDGNDELEHTTGQLSRYFQVGHINSMYDEEKMTEDNSFNDGTDVEPIEEKVLSQKFSQLSTKSEDEQEPSVTVKRRRSSITSSPESVSKKIKLAGDNDDSDHNEKKQDQIPTYLLATNEYFSHVIQKVIHTASSISINDIQQVAILKHNIADLDIQKQISTIYLRSGTGKLREPEVELIAVDRRVWPIQVKSAVSAQPSNMSRTTMEMNEEDQHHAYEELVHCRLQEMNEKIEQYQIQLNEMKSGLIGFTSTMEEVIDTYIQQYGIKPLQMKRDHKIALLEYDYDAEILQRKYLQENPNEYQIKVAERLYETRYDLEQSKREAMELSQRVFYNKPPVSFNSIQIAMSTSLDTTTSTTTDGNIRQRLLDKHEKLIQRKTIDLMAIHISRAEVKFFQRRKIFNEELSKMQENHRNLVKNQGMPTVLTNLIQQRFKNITDKCRDMYNYRINYYLRSPYGDLNDVMKNEKNQNMKTTGFSPSVIIDTAYLLTDKQKQLLNRGPTYVPPCQMHISSSFQTIDDIVRKQYAPLKHQLNILFDKYDVDMTLKMNIIMEIYEQFKKYFTMSPPSVICERAIYERNIVQSIRRSLNENNLILRRTADNQNTFYLGNAQDFEAKANDYLAKTDAFEVLITIDEHNPNEWHNELNKIIKSMNFILKIMHIKNALHDDLFNRLHIDATNIELPYLYFLPDVSKEDMITVLPMISSQRSATSKIANYLNELLGPFVNGKTRSTTFSNETDFSRKLNHYANTEHRLSSSTMFITITISNFYSMVSHKTMVTILGNFLQAELTKPKLQDISVTTIQNLVQLFLYNNIFFYNEKIYTITKGGPNTMALSETLSNICLFQWQKMISEMVTQNKELFGRYKDQIFFTWNGSIAEIRTFLQTVAKTYPDVHLQTFVGSTVHFLNAYVANRNGQLYSRVYHDPTSQGYTLPYVIGHSKQNHSDWLRSALVRAVAYCSSVEDFQQERIYLQLTCLVNGYSLLFVESHIQHFFYYFTADNMRYYLDQTMFDKFRHRLFDFIDVQHELSNKNQRFDNNGTLIRLHYLYEFGPRCQFNQKFHDLWRKHFGNHPVLSKENSLIVLTTKHLHSLNALLAQYKSLK